MISGRFGVFVLAAAVVAAIVASSASAALFFLFKPTTAQTGDLVTVRLGGTRAGFTLDERERPLRNGIRVYLVPNWIAGEIRSRMDPRLHFIGRIVPDRSSRGVLSFRVPPLDTGAYAVAAWCPGCARYSRGRSFFVLPVPSGGAGRFRHLQLLHVRMPWATEPCPVTRGQYGNGLLSTTLPLTGVLSVQRDLSDKLGWLPREGFTGVLTVRGERLDAASPPMKVLGVNWGYSSTGRGSWASAVRFPSEGCWRITGRVRDISLSYVVKVVGS